MAEEKPKRTILNERTLLPAGVVAAGLGGLVMLTGYITKLEARIDSVDQRAVHASQVVLERIDRQSNAILKLQDDAVEIKQGVARLEGKLDRAHK